MMMSMIRNFFIKLKRSCRWFKRMWNNHDFDSNYLIQVIVWKMEDMLYQLDVVDSHFVDLRNQEHYMDNIYGSDMLKSLEDCIEIGKRIVESDYIELPDVVKDWFKTHGLGEIMPDDIEKLLMESYKKSDDMMDKDNEMFFDIMKKYHNNWWS